MSEENLKELYLRFLNQKNYTEEMIPFDKFKEIYATIMNANDYNTDINFVYNQLELFSIIDQDNFRLRFNAVDLVFQYRLYCNMSESKDISWLIDLRDPDTVKGINNKYFTDNPLDLNAL